jgi:hypothetical protein
VDSGPHPDIHTRPACCARPAYHACCPALPVCTSAPYATGHIRPACNCCACTPTPACWCDYACSCAPCVY